MKQYPTFVIKNFLNDDDLIFIENIFKDPDVDLQPERINVYMSQNSKNHINTPIKSNYYYPGETRKNTLHDFINNKIKTLIDTEVECQNWHILNAFVPYTVHSDSFDDSDIEATKLPEHLDYAYTFLVPLDNYDTHTIVFNEESTYTKNPGRWIRENDEPKKYAIDNQMFNKYFSHEIEAPWIFEHLSIDYIFPWTKGDLLVMSRHSFHCSDNFPKKIKEKRALIGWSYKNKKY